MGALASHSPVLPFTAQPRAEPKPASESATLVPIDSTSSLAADHTLLELDRELDLLFDRIQDELEETGKTSDESVAAFHMLCDAFGEKVDRIGRFIRVMEAREAYCRSEAARLAARGKSAENKAAQAKNLVLYFLNSRGIRKMEGKQFTVRAQKNGQDTVQITDETLLPFRFKRVEARLDGGAWEQILDALPETLKPVLISAIHEISPANSTIKLAVASNEEVPGVRVSRGHHIRVA